MSFQGNSVVKYTVTLELITLTLYLIMIVVDKVCSIHNVNTDGTGNRKRSS